MRADAIHGEIYGKHRQRAVNSEILLDCRSSKIWLCILLTETPDEVLNAISFMKWTNINKNMSHSRMSFRYATICLTHYYSQLEAYF